MKIYIISLYSTTSPTRSRIFPDFANSSNVTQFTSFHISFVLAISGHVNRRSKWKYDNPTCTKNLTKFAILVFHSEISCALIITLKLKRKKWRERERERNKYSSLKNFFFIYFTKNIVSHSRECCVNREKKAGREETIIDFIPNSLFILFRIFQIYNVKKHLRGKMKRINLQT